MRQQFLWSVRYLAFTDNKKIQPGNVLGQPNGLIVWVDIKRSRGITGSIDGVRRGGRRVLSRLGLGWTAGYAGPDAQFTAVGSG